MTHKKLVVKIGKVLRKYFDLSFVDSLTIAKAIVRDFDTPESFLNKDEESMIIALHQLTMIEYNKDFVLSINYAIDSKVINIECNIDSDFITYQFTNNKTGKVSLFTIEF